MLKRTLIFVLLFFLFNQNNPAQITDSLPKTINYGGNIAFYPFEYLDSDGKPKGFIMDLLKEIERRTGYKINVQLTPWEDIKSNLISGKKYNLTSLYYSKERESFVDFASPLMITYDGLFIRKNEKEISDISDIVGKQVLVERSGFIEAYLKKNLPQVKTIPVGTEIEALRLINQGQYDAALVNYYSGTANIIRYNLKNIFSESIPLVAREYGFAVGSGNHALLQIINKALKDIRKDGTYGNIYNKWFTTSEEARKYEGYFLWSGIAILFLIVIAVLIFIWSRTLNREVGRKTQELTEELDRRINAEKELLRAKEESEKLSRIKSEFLSQISHEIRTPINVIMGSFELLIDELENNMNDETIFCLDSARCAAKRLIRTIDLIINFSEVQAGVYVPTPKLHDINGEIIDSLLREFNVEAALKGLEIKKEVRTTNTRKKIDNHSINEVFANILDNAIKFTEKGEIKITIEENDDHLIVKIKDTGRGISDEYMSSLFQPFSQEQQGYTRKYEGNGLGLSLANKFCRLNNAEIKVKSQKGKGSEFTVIFN